MTTAIIIVILIFILSIGLFFLIRQFANVHDIEAEVYSEEGTITDFNSMSQEIKENFNEKETNTSSSEELKAKLALFVSAISTFVRTQFKNIQSLGDKYKQNKADRLKQRELAIQESIKKDQEALDLEMSQKAILADDKDTSHFEAEAVSYNDVKEVSTAGQDSKSKANDIENKATDFVAQLLSEVDAISEPADISGEDISDTYYYEYMEKRYIDRIVANSKDIEAYKKLGNLYVDMRNYKDALESFKYVLKLKPNDTIAMRRVKDISHRLKK